MTAPQQPMIIGMFENRAAVAQAINALLKAGFQENQLGFVARQEHIDMLQHQEESKEKTSSSGVIVRGIVGGIMGAIDLLLVPITGPSDASNILATTLPATEEIIDRVTHSGIHAKPQPTVPNGQVNLSERSNAGMTFTPDPSQQQESEQAQERTNRVTGGGIGGIVGTAAILLLPEIGPVVASGLLATVLSGAALGGMAGGFLGTFTNIGVPKRKIEYYEQEVKASRTLVTVHTVDCQAEAIEILRHYGVHDIEIYSHHEP